MAASPVIQAAAATVMTEVTTKGLSTLVDKAVNYTAYKVAYHIVQLEKANEPNTEIQEEKEEKKLCLVTT